MRRQKKREAERAAAAAAGGDEKKEKEEEEEKPKKTQKRKAPEETAAQPAAKKARLEPAAPFTPGLGIAQVLSKAGVVFNVTSLVNALASFSVTHDAVSEELERFLKLIPELKGTTFQAWLKTNTSFFFHLAEVIIDVTRPISALNPDELAAITSGGGDDGGAALIEDPVELEFLRDFMDVAPKKTSVKVMEYTLPDSDFYRELIEMVVSKKKTTPSRFFSVLQSIAAQSIPINFEALFLAAKETAPTGASEADVFKRLGMRLAAVKYIFGK